MRTSKRSSSIAVIDIGSNSSRVVVFQGETAGQLRVLAGTRAALRLVHDVDEKRLITDETIDRAMVALRDFRAIAHGADAMRIAAIATAAMREARNGTAFIRRVRRELGIDIEIIDGRREAYYGFMGALRGLPVKDGIMFDLGGGSLQVSAFRHRRKGRSTSLPLGALRLSETFLESDPPRPREIRRLRDHVRRLLGRARVSKMTAGESLLGTGGTVRNLAKIDQQARHYPISGLHGYVLTAERLQELTTSLAATRARKRDAIPGLSAQRADSIVGGAIAIETLLELVQAPSVIVSGQGVREGVAYCVNASGLPAVAAIQEASLRSLAARFDGWRADAAERRRAITATLMERLDPRAGREVTEAADRAAWLLDIGRSIDFFNRHEHVADIVLATELNGFTHPEIALLAAVLRRAGHPRADLKVLRPLLVVADAARVERAAVILALADDIEERCPRGRPIRLSLTVGRSVTVRVPIMESWRPRTVAPRFERAFGKPLDVIPGSGSG
jgi:exopolyphosphatase/guanosine-5'-triphosphate,3'-diphosphate pyrophosphatase